MKIRLTAEEIDAASSIGLARNQHAALNNASHLIRNTQTNVGRLTGIAQYAFCKLLKRPYEPHFFERGAFFDRSRRKDKTHGFRIRATNYKSGQLIVRDRDEDDIALVLAIVSTPEVHFRGWMMGGKAKNAEFFVGDAYERGYECWMVPPKHLNPMKTLIVEPSGIPLAATSICNVCGDRGMVPRMYVDPAAGADEGRQLVGCPKCNTMRRRMQPYT